MSQQRGADVEIIDSSPDDGILTPSKVLINGVDVGYVARDSVRVKIGNEGDTTEVALTLMPSRITFRHEAS